MGKMNVAYSDVFENLEAVINTDSDKPALSRVYDVSQSVVNKFKLDRLEEKDQDYNEFIKETQNKLEQKRKEQQRLEQERLEQERLEQERLEQKRKEQEILEQERLEQERKEQERLEQEKEQENQKQIDRIYQKLKLNTVKSKPIKTEGTKPLATTLNQYYQNENSHQNQTDNTKKLLISNIKGETLYETLININQKLNFKSIELPDQYKHEQINSIKFDKDNDDNEIINIVINKKDVDIKKVIYRKIIPVDENENQLKEPLIQSIVFRGKYDIESDQNQWFSQDLKFESIYKLPIIHGKSCEVDIVQPLTINVQAFEDQHEIETKILYKDMYDLIEQDKDYEVIFKSNQSLSEVDRIEHMIIKCGYVRNVYTNQIYSIRITPYNQKMVLDQINKNSQYQVKDFEFEGNRIIAYIEEKEVDKNQASSNIDTQKDQSNQINKSKYKPVKKEIKEAFNKVDIPKAYQYHKYQNYTPIELHVNDMEYYNEINNRYMDQFLKHINLVRKELKLPKMKKLKINNDYQIIEQLLKTNQEIVNNKIDDIDTRIIDFCKEYINEGNSNSMFDFISLQRKVGVNHKLSPEYLADRDFEKVINRINSFKEHRELAQDREINHIIRNKSYLLTSLFIKDIAQFDQSKNKQKFKYDYSTIKIYN